MIAWIDVIECSVLVLLIAAVALLIDMIRKLRGSIAGLAYYIRQKLPGDLPPDVENLTGRRGNHRGP